MSDDPIVDEVRAIRDAIADENHYDLDAIFEMLRKREAASPALHAVSKSPKSCARRSRRASMRSSIPETISSLVRLLRPNSERLGAC